MIEQGFKDINLVKQTIRFKDQDFKLIKMRKLIYWYLKHFDKANEELNHIHCRFGHPGRTKTTVINKLYGTNSHKRNCESCLQAKASRHYFPVATQNPPKEKLQLVQADIMEVGTLSFDGKLYVCDFRDIFTKYSYIECLVSKSNALNVFKAFVQNVGKPRTLRTDNGGEFASKEFKHYCLQQSIRQEFTVPYSSQQNGGIERFWRTLMNVSRANLLECKISKEFWPYAVEYSCYQINCWPYEDQDKRITTPYEAMTGKKPNISLLHTFGCDAYTMQLKHERTHSKLSRRAKVSVFLGIPRNVKGYYLLNTKYNTISIKRDVVFIEESYEEAKKASVLVEDDPKDLDFQNPGRAKLTEGEEETEAEFQIEPRRHETVQEPPGTEPNDQESEVESEITSPYQDQESPESQPTRKSTRTRQPPKEFWKATEVNVLFEGADPKTYKQATTAEDHEEWDKAMRSEIQSLENLKTWNLVERPKDRNVISSKWVFKKKFKGGAYDKHKARFCARGFSQKEGVDYDLTFAPVARHSTTRIFIAKAAQMNRSINRIDIKNAYLNAEVKEDIYLELPQGYYRLMGRQDKKQVAKLNKSLYGLKQSARNWYLHFKSVLEQLGFNTSQVDPCLFTNGDQIILIYVDDVLLNLGDNLQDFLKKIKMIYTLSEEESLAFHLGLDYMQTEKEIFIHQRSYIQELAKTHNMTQCKPRPTPTTNQRLIPKQDFEESLPSSSGYRQLVGSLLWISIQTRPDITYAVYDLCKQLSKPTQAHLNAAKRVLAYLITTQDRGLRFRKNMKTNTIRIYTDADWSSDIADSKSTSGYIVLLNGTPISWCSRKQNHVALSSCESEYIALSECVKESLYIQKLVKEFNFDLYLPLSIGVDNQSTITIASNQAFHRRTKHINRIYDFVRDEIKQGNLTLHYVPTSDNFADGFTKPLIGNKFHCYLNNVTSSLKGSVENANSLLAHFQNDLHRRNEDLEEKTCFYSITVDKNTQYSIPVGNRTKLSQGQEYSSYSEQLCYPALSLQTTLKKVSKVQLLTQSFEGIPAKNWTRIMKNAGNRVSRLGAKSGMESQGNLPIPPTDRPN